MTIVISLLSAVLFAADSSSAAGPYFKITVVDDQTGRGVPLVELETVNHIVHYTDSNGVAAFYEPGLMGREVFFHIRSHGYEFPADGFGMHGRAIHVTPGGEVRLEIKRLNIAERLYRITGGGIYRDSVLTGCPAPIDEPVLNGSVLGQDSILAQLYQNKIYWFWGDTSWPRYPLGNFHMAGATSRLPSAGGLDPDVGINLTYFVDENGFAKKMAPRPEPGPVWLSGLVKLPDEAGDERMYATYSRVTPSMEAVERGFMAYRDERAIFEKVSEFDVDAPVRPGGHPIICSDGGEEFIWFSTPFPLVRVKANREAYLDISRYEAWTPLRHGSTVDTPEIDRDGSGSIRYAWKAGTPALDPKQQNGLIESGKLEPDEAWIQLQDADSGKPVLAYGGSVYWNAFRQRWVTIRCEGFGTSMLGEIWYAEADTPIGPWVYARKVVTHDRYDFYNPKHHPFFDKDDGRIIYFEGTYVNTFSGNPEKTPRYDYNQIMYKLDLSDERLVLPVPVYRHPDSDNAITFHTMENLPEDAGRLPIAFFACDRPAAGLVAVRREADATGGKKLVARSSGDDGREGEGSPVFFALPSDQPDPPATSLPLYEYVNARTSGRLYSIQPDDSKPGYERSEAPVCRVWRNPLLPHFRWPATAFHRPAE